ncbi:MAG: ribonuclease R [Pseudomonadota bacterium]
MSDEARKLPTRDEILEFINDAPGPVTKREIARAFRVRGEDRVELKALLRSLDHDGVIEKAPRRGLSAPGRLPSVTVIKVVSVSGDGDVWAEPQNFEGDGPAPRILVKEGPPKGRSKRGRSQSVAVGALILARLVQRGEIYEARIMKLLSRQENQILGLFEAEGSGGRIRSVNKKIRDEWQVAPGDTADAQTGELVAAEVLSSGRRALHPTAKVIERFGDALAPRAVSLIAIEQHGIPTTFPEAALEEAQRATNPPLGKRTDLRHLPFLTIDPADARDHDDAVFVEPGQAEGFIIWVAIADVSAFVKPGSALDNEALKRGNSCYFPDRVVPMLPEALSNDLCSLRAGVDRASLVARLTLSADGLLQAHHFERALIRVVGNVSYEEVQAAQNAGEGELAGKVAPLYAAYQLLAAARDHRGPLALDLPERRIVFSDDGEVHDIAPVARLDAHRLIEEFMILANVAAARVLSPARIRGLYRVHEEPDREKIDTLRDFLEPLDIKIAKGQVITPKLFNRVLARAKDTPHAQAVSEIVLRSQTQAYYGADNLGHFGLALTQYSHFTSPIRRYADLVVHRAISRILSLPEAEGISDDELARLDDTAEHISRTERRTMAAERDTRERYVAAFYAERIGELFAARVSGVSRFGLFLTLEPAGGDAILPISSLGDEYFIHDEPRGQLVGERSGDCYRLGDRFEVELIEADRLTGGLRVDHHGRAPRRLKKHDRPQGDKRRNQRSPRGKHGGGRHRQGHSRRR